MYRFHCLIVSILILLIIEKPEFANGDTSYRWITLQPGEKLPTNSVFVYESTTRYIGRARHFDEILPAEIYANGSAVISSCHKIKPKEKYEVLTLPEQCVWKSFSEIQNLDDTAVRIGTAWNGEPTYIVASRSDYYNSNYYYLDIIYLTKNQLFTWNAKSNIYYQDEKVYLSCPHKTKWIDTAAVKLPNNTVSGGKSEDGHDIYVAQLKRGCDIVGGQAIPEMGTATAFLNDGRPIEASYCQVLVGEPDEYTWITASDGEIPDYAVVNGKHGNEIAYVARFNKTLGHLTHSEALEEQLDYEILVAKP
ncbi:uncharacterized protein LOC129947979 [Eupeodes corollae]|uniref:uncharacterized protein LOC129947979 n=1 Tax=Eupeodes corollae TaxID=290404 RepID=UPI0024923FC1|nr:uncharacterized protein LOC129947979 [Eupeodes corollae]